MIKAFIDSSPRVKNDYGRGWGDDSVAKVLVMKYPKNPYFKGRKVWWHAQSCPRTGVGAEKDESLGLPHWPATFACLVSYGTIRDCLRTQGGLLLRAGS